MRYWWVNHAQTFKQEIEGGYLWSPLNEASGARSQFYDNMHAASPGDLIVSYAKGAIRRFGFVDDFAFIAPKPSEFGAIGDYWGATGWLLPVQWLDSDILVRPKDFFDELRPLLPLKYSPMNADTGSGNQKAYLAEIGGPAFSLIVQHAGVVLPEASQARSSLHSLTQKIDDLIVTQVGSDATLSKTEREQIIQARRGQGIYRRRVIELEGTCRVTGISDPTLLVASHIKPWRTSTPLERLDGCNGLMLAPHIDFLFDRGYMTFTELGDIQFSSRLSHQNLSRFGLSVKLQGVPRAFKPETAVYLDYHRSWVFIP